MGQSLLAAVGAGVVVENGAWPSGLEGSAGGAPSADGEVPVQQFRDHGGAAGYGGGPADTYLRVGFGHGNGAAAGIAGGGGRGGAVQGRLRAKAAAYDAGVYRGCAGGWGRAGGV